MLKALHAPADALVVMDAGIATEDNVAWLRATATAIWWSAANAPAVSTQSGSIAIETRSHHKDLPG